MAESAIATRAATGEEQELLDLDTMLWRTRAEQNQLFQEVADLVIPELEDVLQSQRPGQIYGQRIFDGTTRQAAELYTNGIYGHVVNPASVWFRFRVSNKRLNDVREVKLWLQEAEEAVYAEFSNSNFYREVWPFILHGATIGLAGMSIVDDFLNDRILYPHVSPMQLAISQGQDGRINTASRKERQEVKWFIERFGINNVNQAMRDLYASDPFKIIEAHHVITPRQTFRPNSPLVEDMPIASAWIYNGEVFFKSGFRYFPAAFWRHTVIGPNNYGGSPATKMLPDIRTLNTMGRTLLKSAALAAQPPMNVHKKQQGIENFVPGGNNYFGTNDEKASPIDMLGNKYPIGIDREEARQRMIRQAYSVDFFLSLLSSERQMTAEEVARRQSESSVVLAPEVSRFTWEPLEPIIDATFAIALERGRIPEPPAILQELAGTSEGKIGIDFVGPLVTAQNLLLTGKPISRTLAETAQLAGATGRADLLDNFDLDGAVRKNADLNDFPEELLVDKKAVAQKRIAKTKLLARQQQGDQAEQASKTVKNLSDASPAVGGAIDQAVEELTGGA
jgi:hypothetical protein